MSKTKEGTKRNVRQQGHDKLEAMIHSGWGRSKHQDKQQNQTNQYIYASSTASSYHRNWNKFCDYMQKHGYQPKTLEEAALYVEGYIEALKVKPGRWGLPKKATTIRTYFAAVAKVLGLSCKDYNLPSRERKNIRRSRGVAGQKPSRSPKVQEVQAFQRCVGLRNCKELQQLRGTDLEFRNGEFLIIVRSGKGGLCRECPVWGTEEEKQNVIQHMQAAGDGLVWPKGTIPRHYDAHADRAYYASRMYLDIEREIADVPRKEQYICRKEMYGTVYDKRALYKVSLALGHYRNEIVVGHYLWRVEELRAQ